MSSGIGKSQTSSNGQDSRRNRLVSPKQYLDLEDLDLPRYLNARQFKRSSWRSYCCTCPARTGPYNAAWWACSDLGCAKIYCGRCASHSDSSPKCTRCGSTMSPFAGRLNHVVFDEDKPSRLTCQFQPPGRSDVLAENPRRDHSNLPQVEPYAVFPSEAS